MRRSRWTGLLFSPATRSEDGQPKADSRTQRTQKLAKDAKENREQDETEPLRSTLCPPTKAEGTSFFLPS